MQSDQLPNTGSELSTPAQFRAKLGSYLAGVIIGFIFLGMVYFMKHLAVESKRAEAASGASAGASVVETEGQP